MPSIWQLTIIRSPEKTLITGVLVKNNSFATKAYASSLKSAYAIASSYFRKTVAETPLELKWGDGSWTLQTDTRGEFRLELDGQQSFKGKPVFMVQGNAIPYKEEVLQDFVIKAKGSLIISDLDDTILESHTRQKVKRLLTTLTKTYDRRRPVVATGRILDLLKKRNDDFVYVSRSESNLYPLLSDFIRHHGLPAAPLFLTPYLNFKELVENKKDPDFKRKTIQFLLDRFDHENVILIGDDTQEDLHVYADISSIYGSRIKSICIRQVDKRIDRKKTASWSELADKADALYFNESTDIEMIKKYLK